MWNYLLISGIVTLISLLFRHNLSTPLSVVEHAETQYDYIVVGAGTAGCVIASRLSENPNVSVLLVEAGGYFSWLSSIPLVAPGLQKSAVDWAYKTQTQTFSSKGLWDAKQQIPRGKGLGGSGQLNYLVHSFGRPEDYADWPKGWKYDDLKPYFQKVVDLMNVNAVSSNEKLVQAVSVAKEAFNDSETSFRKASMTSYKGTRWSTYNAHLQKAWDRKNLHILMNSMVTKVLMDWDKRVKGVEIKNEDGVREKIEAKLEVILCAGTINTPQLMMLSGIGPTEELESHQIIVYHDLPAVGRNFIDHLNMPLYVNLKSSVSITLRKLQSITTITEYFTFGTGHLATNGIMAMVRVNNSGLTLCGMASTDEKLLKELSNMRTETFRALFPAYNNSAHEGFLYMANCLQPKSRGRITLKSSSISDPPLIDPSYLMNHYDLSCTQEAIKLAIETLDTPLFREFGAKLHVPNLEECQHLIKNYEDDAFSECAIRVAGLTSHHQCGTCRMGSGNNSVVDNMLRVHGVKGLRIIDASILPSPISGMPNSVIVAIAEKAADLFKSETVEDINR